MLNIVLFTLKFKLTIVQLNLDSVQFKNEHYLKFIMHVKGKSESKDVAVINLDDL